jgi:uncharacterized protein
MTAIHSTVSCNLDISTIQTCLPLLEMEQIDALEWSWDALYKLEHAIPDWFEALLLEFGTEQRLIGHGVFYSLFSGRWSEEQKHWLEQLKLTAKHFHFDHVTEHFGFFTGTDFHKGAPISVPFSDRTLRIGRDRLARMHDAAQCPVGIENLAVAYAYTDVQEHGAFLEALVEPINGFIILDLHNLYCQLHNFRVEFDQMIHAYPLGRVREIHISGGSWESLQSEPALQVRRDTHDDGVPERVFEMLQATIPLCPNLKYVVMEQLGTALATLVQQEQFRADFLRMRSIVQSYELKHKALSIFLPEKNTNVSIQIPEDLELYHEQMALSNILENAHSCHHAHELLAKSKLANSEWKVEQWSVEMLETCMQIAQKWKGGW